MCGCKGSSFGLCDMRFWYYNDLKGTLQLFQGHGFTGRPLGTFKSYKAMNKKTLDTLKEAATHQKDDLKVLLKLIG